MIVYDDERDLVRPATIDRLEAIPADPTQVWLTPAEVAARLQVSRSTLYRLRREGRGPRETKVTQRISRVHLNDMLDYEKRVR